MSDQLTFNGDLVVVTCWCGIRHGIPAEMNRWANQDVKHGVHCPIGHRWVRRQTEVDQLRARLTSAEDQAVAASVEAERLRVALVRDRHRFANGVCPCCNRSFPALTRHMATKHPDFDASVIEVDRGRKTLYRCTCGRSFETPHGLAIHQGRSRSDGWAEPDASRWRAHLTVV